MAGEMATWGPQRSTADECSLTCSVAAYRATVEASRRTFAQVWSAYPT